MFSLLLFVGALFILCIEGRCVLQLLAGPRLSKCELWLLGLPLGALLNALLFFLFTIVGITLSAFTMYFAHLFVIAFLGALVYQRKPKTAHTKRVRLSHFSRVQKILLGVLVVSLFVKVGYGTSQALVFPTYSFDSLSQWTMRSRISYEDRAIAFDQDEKRGLSKPQYPILLHALQIMVMLPQEKWSDTYANVSTLLLTLTSFAGFGFLLSRKRGVLLSALTLATIFMIPLVARHLSQGHGDIHLLQYLLLSALFLYLYAEEKKLEWLTLSSLFIAASAWVKVDGLFFGVLPWLLCVLLLTVKQKKKWMSQYLVLLQR